MQVVGSVITVADGSLLQFTNNTNTGAGGTLYVLSLGLIIIGDGVTMIFSGNKGRYFYLYFEPALGILDHVRAFFFLYSFGASIVVEGYIPLLFQHIINNTLCFIQHELVGVYPQAWKGRNVSNSE